MFLLRITFVINGATARMKVNDTPIIFKVDSLIENNFHYVTIQICFGNSVDIISTTFIKLFFPYCVYDNRKILNIM